MKTTRNRLTAVALCLLLALSLTACGGTKENVGGSSAVYPENVDANGTGTFSDYAEDGEVAAPESGEEAVGEETGVTLRDENRKLITTVRIEAETRDYDSFLAWLDGKLAEAGGYIENSEMWAYDETNRNCHLKLRVPEGDLDGLLTSMGDNCNILDRSVSQEDVTLNYVDTKSHRDALQVEQERLLELLERAETLEDIIALEERLTSVRYQLQTYESALRVLDNQVSYSTIELSLREVRELTEPVPESWGSRAWAGMKENARDIGCFFQELGLFLVTHLPTLALLGVVALAVWLATIKPRRKARERRRQQQELIQSMQQGSAPAKEKE